MKDNIRIYGVRDSYIKFLSQYQEHLFLHESGSSGRKYIGVVLEINHLSYFAPLSSFKSKHRKMKESVDFIKIKDYAVININNMIPVPKRQLIELNINDEINPQVVDEICSVPWGHHRYIIDKCKGDTEKALFYVRKAIENNWSRTVLHLLGVSTD